MTYERKHKDRLTYLVLIILVINLFFAEYLNKQLMIIPRQATWIPEIISLIVVVLILLRFAILKDFAIGLKYMILLSLFITIFAASSLINLSGPGAIIVGMRTYLKSLPLFLLPAVFKVDSKRLKNQLLFILPLLLLQCPMAFFQRLIQFGLDANGDNIRGTLNTSGVLTFVMICSIAILNGFYQKKLLKLRYFIILSLILFIPTTINETKVTVAYLPLSIIIPFVFVNEHRIANKIKKLVAVVAMGAILAAIFIPVYNYFMQPRWGYGIFEFITSGKATEYVYSGTPYNVNKNWRRGDRLVVAADTVSKDLGTFFFGYGPGNVIDSYLNDFQDSTVDATAKANAQAVTNLIWENGFLGLLTYVSLLFLIYKDASLLRKQDSFMGGFSLGWCAVVILSGLNLFYQNILIMNIINYLFWYFSGVVASQAYRFRNAERFQQVQPLYRLAVSK